MRVDFGCHFYEEGRKGKAGWPDFTGQNIRLMSCNTGQGSNSVAQGLADVLGVPGGVAWPVGGRA